jgi:crotonobetainyl-CoA:carnitine CoA-transferase CaiB-like acyl-CoA transferase
MTQPLHGTRVLELGSFVTAPLAAMMLADLGAEVIKIERPDGGDPFRAFTDGRSSYYFRGLNRNKKSVVVDLNDAEGQSVVRRLAETADVFLANFRPGYLDRSGLGYDALAQANPRLVYCAITGYGPDGPYRARPSYDTVGQAMSGLLSLYVNADHTRMNGIALSDSITGIYTAYAILGGLAQRDRTGKGLRVETNQLAATMALIGPNFVGHFDTGGQPGIYDKSVDNHSFVLVCRDGKMIAIHLSSPPKFWQGLIAASGSPTLGTDPRFADRAGRRANYAALQAELDAIFAQHPRSYWLGKLEEHDVPFSALNTLADAAADPQVAHLGVIQELHHPKEGVTRVVGRPVWYDRDNGSAEAFAPPSLGEHTEEILASLLPGSRR